MNLEFLIYPNNPLTFFIQENFPMLEPYRKRIIKLARLVYFYIYSFIFLQNQETLNWRQVPAHVRRMVVQKLDKSTRATLRQCSKHDRDLVDSSPTIHLDTVEIFVTKNYVSILIPEIQSSSFIQMFSRLEPLVGLLRRTRIKNLKIESYDSNHVGELFNRISTLDFNLTILAKFISWNCRTETSRELRKFLSILDRKCLREIHVKDAFLMNLDLLMETSKWKLIKNMYNQDDVFLEVEKNFLLKKVLLKIYTLNEYNTLELAEKFEIGDENLFENCENDQVYTFQELSGTLDRVLDVTKA
ncbi:hypothetical protein L5515_001284 [Caenorhabditis briggsae]|uniref:F-box domain-containing protein n=1 Tax=Caenorhabditis briggsae TaxID=6238 RepID=A0AAE9DU10_CAEBR|nr:hypothetical protein L3Y34_015210 [Caenorhabditis briggsae]UMM12577.1 hypothetical protein L5515_001284 [Caenorhabditis briggsae]